MQREPNQLLEDAQHIWQAGVDAVMPERLIPAHLRVDGNRLFVGEQQFDLEKVRKIAIVGAGKAAGAMAVACEASLGTALLAEKEVHGWVNVPADCMVPTRRIRLHAGRPSGVNEPRPEGVKGTREILKIVSALGPEDLCICLIAGGGSALLVAPVPEVSLAEKVRVTQLLSAAGANIEQLNTVRRQISLVKGGGLARACGAGHLSTLIISDVLGDPLEAISSGPTVLGHRCAQDALDVLEEFKLLNDPDIQSIAKYLHSSSSQDQPWNEAESDTRFVNFVIGNNGTAVNAAGVEAERRGYSHAMVRATAAEGPAEEVGRQLAEMAERMRCHSGPDCLITGGEPVVQLVNESLRGKGGRSQQLALAALEKLQPSEGVVLLAGGTDGEDGPTDAAGAWIDEQVVRTARFQGLDVADHLRRNDAYHFFEKAGGLFKTGPTHTNVCDLRVVTVSR
ncbi:MAG: DUF4147 domain-containing protein [Pirellulales bacterium]|nr:DUF4147 domain-containing protein [Pirellulales bacterium]